MRQTRIDTLVVCAVAVAVSALSGCRRDIGWSMDDEPSSPNSSAEAVEDEPSYHQAVGDPAAIEEDVRPLFATRDHFNDLPEPEPGDWLAVHDEPGQTFEQFRKSDPRRPSGRRDTIYVQPIGSFGSEESPSLEKLETFTEAYFQTPTVVRSALDLEKLEVTERQNPHTGQRQLLTTDLIELLKKRLPPDGFAVVGVTMIDLYPKPSWNFVFGQAYPQMRSGIYSFARYTGDPDHPILWRSAKVMAHEIGHLFGLGHCIYFECGMNGSNNLEESDSRPLHLCPVDLRKLYWSVEFDPVARYRQLREFYRKQNWTDERAWIQRRLDVVPE